MSNKLAALAVLIFTGSALYAQVSGAITGTVYDSSGAPVQNAAIVLRGGENGIERQSKTDGAGRYGFELLPAGKYDLEASAPGFKKSLRQGLGLTAADRLQINFNLELGEQSTTVSVTASEPLVQSETGQVSYSISTQQITELSLNGRNFLSFQQLIPGAARTAGDEQGVGFNSAKGFAIDGLREKYTGVMVDGIRNTDMGSNNTQLTTPGQETLSEVKMLVSNYSAEYSSSGGAEMVLTTRSGTTQFHGAAYEFVRNNAFDARNFFDQSNAPLRYNNFGWRLGGPVFIPHLYNRDRNKTFFFFGEEWRRTRTASILTAATPTTAMRSGDFSAEAARLGQPILDPTTGLQFPNNQIPAGRINKNASILMNQLFPLPNSPNTGFLNYSDDAKTSENYRQELVRVDHNFSDKIRLMFRFVHDSWQNSVPTTLWQTSSFPSVSSVLNVPSKNIVGRLTTVINPTLLNEVSFSYTNDYGSQSSYAVNLQGNYLRPSDLNIGRLYPLPAGRPDVVPNLNFNGGWGSISTGYYPWWAKNEYYDVHDVATKIWGAQTLKFGGEYMWTNTPDMSQAYPSVNGLFNFTGAFTNDPIADFLLGDPYSYQELHGYRTSTYHFQQLEAFVQDDWKASSRLTLNLGLRYYYIPHAYEQNNQISVFRQNLYNPANAPVVLPDTSLVPNTGNPLNGIATAGQDGVPKGLVKNYPWTFAPRFGFAYDLTGTQRTVLRGGYGTDYYRVEQNDTQGLVGNPPFSSIQTVFNPPLDNPAAGTPGAAHTPSLTTLDPNYKHPTIQNWSFGIQHQLASETLLSVAYVGSRGTHLDRGLQLNYPYPQAGYDFDPRLNLNTIPIELIAPYRGYSAITMYENTASSRYNSLQVELQKRFSNGFQYQVVYTFSRAMDDADDFGALPQDPFNLRREWSLANFDRTHMLVFSYIYDLPFFKNSSRGFLRSTLGGWELTGITTFQSGQPVDLGLSGGNIGLATRPDVVAGSKLSYPKTVAQWFDTSAFAAPAYGFYGDAGRNLIRGPGIEKWDVSLFKNFSLAERAKLQFRAESFNLFNHTNLWNVNTTLGSGNFGQVTSARDPRILQFALKLEF